MKFLNKYFAFILLRQSYFPDFYEPYLFYCYCNILHPLLWSFVYLSKSTNEQYISNPLHIMNKQVALTFAASRDLNSINKIYPKYRFFNSYFFPSYKVWWACFFRFNLITLMVWYMLMNNSVCFGMYNLSTLT